jgi:hypothetical protein
LVGYRDERYFGAKSNFVPGAGRVRHAEDRLARQAGWPGSQPRWPQRLRDHELTLHHRCPLKAVIRRLALRTVRPFGRGDQVCCGRTADGPEGITARTHPDLLKCGGAKGIRTPTLTRQNASVACSLLPLVSIRSRPLTAGSFSGLDGFKSSRRRRSDNRKRGLSDRRLRDRSGPMRCQDAGNRAAGASGPPAASPKGSRV